MEYSVVPRFLRIKIFNFRMFYNDHRFLDEPSGKAERNRLNRLL